MISVIGLGKIGLPLAVQCAQKGYRVFGIDINESVINLVNSGKEPFPGEELLEVQLENCVSKGALTAHLPDSGYIEKSQTIVVVVPLYVDMNGKPAFENIDSAVRAIGSRIRKGSLVCFETTLPIGTTRNRFVPILEEHSAMKAGEDFFVAFSPERVFAGRFFKDIGRYPKIVGGINEQSEQIAKSFYESIIDFEIRPDLPRENGVWTQGSAEVAEFVKLAETTYRDVNIALANQFSLFAYELGVDVLEVIDAANSQNFSNIHRPGIAVGGHCIPVYPHLYLEGDPTASIVRMARELNLHMPEVMISRLIEIHGSTQDQNCLILGLSYRGGVKETYLSGTFSINRELRKRGVNVYVHDPLYSEEEISDLGFLPFIEGQPIDMLILQADHYEYVNWNSESFPNLKTVLDGRGILNKKNWQVQNFASVVGVARTA